MTLHWEKLSPTEFQQLQDFATYSTRKLKDVLNELHSSGGTRFHPDGEIDYESFKLFVNTYLEVDSPDELCRHLFLSFVKRPMVVQQQQQQQQQQQLPPSPITGGLTTSNSFPASDPGSGHGVVVGKTIKEMATISTTAVPGAACSSAGAGPSCYTKTGSLSSIVALSTQTEHLSMSTPSSEKHFGIAEKFHGLTEKLQNLGHHRSDSESSSARQRTGSLASIVRPLLKFASSYDRKSNDSTPSQDARVALGAMAQAPVDINLIRVPLKDIVCYLSLLEGGRPEDKLEFMFRLYDTDGNGVLDTYELDCVLNQMMNVAEYLGWDVSELKPILQDMMIEIDFDADGEVSLEEWKRGGLTTIPLLVLLGLDQDLKEDGKHLWRLKHFSRPAFCNLCLNMLVGLGKKGLCCILCKYTVHERCVQRAPSSCITTYVKSKKTPQVMTHHWVEGNCHGRCFKCKKTIKSYNGITGRRCRWCQISLHSKCASLVKPECNLGEFRTHILPPISICPIVLDRHSFGNRSTRSETRSETLPSVSDQASDNTSLSLAQSTGGPTSFQITPLDDTHPLLIFINPKSGGLQGTKLLKKFQYFLNPRQVYNLAGSSPVQALQMFKDVPNMRVICCGGDGTVGWILDSMDKVQFVSQPGVGVIPLGTGNDLARCLRWGSGFEGEDIGKVLKKIDKSTVVMMDRWQITVTDVDENEEPGDPMPYNIINNYFSVGVDAAICVKFHMERERNPHKFNSRMRNKMWYFEFGMSEQFTSSCKNLHQEIEVECDGVALELGSGPALQGLALLNIPYTHGGTNLWGDQLSRRRASRNSKARKKGKEKEPSTSSATTDLSTAVQDIGDNLIEVIGLENCLHMGQVRTGLRSSGRRLAQCSSIVIRTKKRLPMQIDGEPWMQPPSTICVTHKNQVPMLLAPLPEMKGFFKFLKSS